MCSACRGMRRPWRGMALKTPAAYRLVPLTGIGLEEFKAFPEGFPSLRDDMALSGRLNRFLTRVGLRETAHSSLVSSISAPTNRTMASSLGKMPMTSARRFTSRFTRSSGFVDAICASARAGRTSSYRAGDRHSETIGKRGPDSLKGKRCFKLSVLAGPTEHRLAIFKLRRHRSSAAPIEEFRSPRL